MATMLVIIALAEGRNSSRWMWYTRSAALEAALAALSGMLPDSADERAAGFAALREVLGVSGALTEAASERLGRVAELFGVATEPVAILPRGGNGGRRAS
jgi:hypothetical protein